MAYGILLDVEASGPWRVINSWLRDDFSKDAKRFPSKASAEKYAKLSFGPFPAVAGAVKAERFRKWTVQRIPTEK